MVGLLGFWKIIHHESIFKWLCIDKCVVSRVLRMFASWKSVFALTATRCTKLQHTATHWCLYSLSLTSWVTFLKSPICSSFELQADFWKFRTWFWLHSPLWSFCGYTHTRTHAHAHTHTHIHTHTHTHAHSLTHTHAHAHTHTFQVKPPAIEKTKELQVMMGYRLEKQLKARVSYVHTKCIVQ